MNRYSGSYSKALSHVYPEIILNEKQFLSGIFSSFYFLLSVIPSLHFSSSVLILSLNSILLTPCSESLENKG